MLAPDGAAHGGVGRRADATRSQLALPGRFNQANALMAAVAAEALRRRRRRGARRPWRPSSRWPAASPCAPSATCGPGSCWPRTRPAGTSCSTWWPDRTRRSWSASTRGWPTAPTRAGCGTCPSSAWPGGPWWRPGTAAATSRCACTTPAWRTRREPDPVAAPWPRAAGGTGGAGGAVDVIGNYTAFHDLLGAPGVSAPLRVAVVYPDLLGTYGDGGNGLILARRAEWRGLRRRAAAGRLGPRPARGRHLLPGRGRGRPPGPGRPHADRRRDAGPAGGRRRGRAGGVRRLPDRRAELSRRRRRAARGRGPPRRRHRQGRRGRAPWARCWPTPDGRRRTLPVADGLREPRRARPRWPRAPRPWAG